MACNNVSKSTTKNSNNRRGVSSERILDAIYQDSDQEFEYNSDSDNESESESEWDFPTNGCSVTNQQPSGSRNLDAVIDHDSSTSEVIVTNREVVNEITQENNYKYNDS